MGYQWLEGWELLESLYMTIITLTTVGFGEVRPLNNAGKVFTVVLIIAGVGTVAYSIGLFTEFMVEGRLRDILGKRKLQKEIDKLKDHYIVCGYGRIGKIVCQEFIQHQVPFVIIEKEPQFIDEINQEGLLVIAGDATDESALLKAGVDRAKALVAVLSCDADNVFITLTARGLNPNLFIVARAEGSAAEQKLIRAGADKVVLPYLVGGNRLANAVLRPAVVDFIEIASQRTQMDLLMEEIAVMEGSRLDNKALKDSGISRELGIIIIAIKKTNGEMVFNPSFNTEIFAGDKLIALGNPDQLKKLEFMAHNS
jgi:voltage-gated potassium channel